MQQSDPLSERALDSLAGCWHKIGALELRRLVVEGATLVCQESPTMVQDLDPGIVIVSEDANFENLQSSIPDKQALLICVGPEWGPAHDLAARMSDQGYEHVFTPETDWDKTSAINSFGAHDQV